MDLASLPLRRPAIGPRAMVPLAGIVAGTLDLIYASTFWGIQKDLSPLQILQSVAAGWLGRATYEGGYPSALLGLVSHYGIAITMAAGFYLAFKRWPALARQTVLSGSLYGIALLFVMHYVVVPVSNAGNEIGRAHV